MSHQPRPSVVKKSGRLLDLQQPQTANLPPSVDPIALSQNLRHSCGSTEHMPLRYSRLQHVSSLALRIHSLLTVEFEFGKRNILR